MIRLNAFFEVKDNASIDAVKNLGTELVNKSRNDEGCVSYDLFTSATRPFVMMFCETWKDEEVLKAHIGLGSLHRTCSQNRSTHKERIETGEIRVLNSFSYTKKLLSTNIYKRYS